MNTHLLLGALAVFYKSRARPGRGIKNADQTVGLSAMSSLDNDAYDSA